MSGVVTASLLPDKVRRRHDEEDFQRAAWALMTVALPPDAVAFAVPNGGLRSKKAAARLQGMGVVAGIPDLCVVHRGRAVFVELKAKHGTFSAAQRAMERRLIYAGADVCLCRSVPEVEAALRAAGIPLRASVSA
jgi:hypothetical protein